MSANAFVPIEFPTTHWSMVVAAGQESGQAKRAALQRLLEAYVPAMRTYLIRHWRMDAERAADLLQRFLLDKVLERDLIARADQNRGRFRSFLMVALDRFVLNVIREEKTAKRSPGRPLAAILDDEADAAQQTTTADLFDIEWARQLLMQAVAEMRQECAACARPDIWGVFEGRVLHPILEQIEPVPYETLIRQYAFISPAQASNVLVTANRMFSRKLRALIGQYEKTDEEIDEELMDLRKILSSRAGRS